MMRETLEDEPCCPEPSPAPVARASGESPSDRRRSLGGHIAGDRGANGDGTHESHEFPSVTYDTHFWFTCAAHAGLMVSISTTFYYAYFVEFYGGGEGLLGWIAGIGMVGAMLMRGFQGVAIDRYGPRIVWMGSLLLLALSLAAHTFVSAAAAPTVFLLRIMMMTGLAGAFGASMAFISLRSPEARMPEMIGVMGSFGFFGQIIGPIIGDWLFRGGEITAQRIDRMFYLAAAAALVTLAFAAAATWHEPRRKAPRLPSLWSLLRTYHPGWLLMMGIAMGTAVGMPQTFVRPFTASIGIERIQIFFIVYGLSAFGWRILTRQFTDIFGVRTMNVVGLGTFALSTLLYLTVTSEWMLILPAFAGGAAHAFLFPAVVGGGTRIFPKKYRGVGMTLMLAMFDAGNLVGQPLIGGLIVGARQTGWPAYPTMFVVMSGLFTAICVVYACAVRGRH